MSKRIQNYIDSFSSPESKNDFNGTQWFFFIVNFIVLWYMFLSGSNFINEVYSAFSGGHDFVLLLKWLFGVPVLLVIVLFISIFAGIISWMAGMLESLLVLFWLYIVLGVILLLEKAFKLESK